MKPGTLVLLVLLVLGLSGLWWWKERARDQGGPRLELYPLCPGLAVERVRALHIDHLERGLQIGLERDAQGAWFMTDPVAYPAQSAVVRLLLATLSEAQCEDAPGMALGALGLDPPRVVLELTQVEETGERTFRVELGGADLAPERIFARVPGHPHAAERGGTEVFRTTRTLFTTLERNPSDYRDRRATSLSVQDVISLRRRGEVYMEEEGRRVDLQFDALLEPDGWKRVGQPTVSLDPSAMSLLARGAAELSVDGFADDSPTDLVRFGLQPPAFTIELQGLTGAPVVLRFGTPPTSEAHPIGELNWYGLREGYAHVWEVTAHDVELLTRPASLFFDQHVVRMFRQDVAELELVGGGTTRVLERQRAGWTVRADTPDGAGTPFPADPAAVEEALALLERVQLTEHLPAEVFAPQDPPLTFRVRLKNGARLGGAIGGPARDEKSGAQGRQYLRDGDEVVALIGEETVELCQRPLDAFRSKKVHELQESLVRWISLAHGERTYTFVNTGDNRWRPEGETIEAPRAFVLSLDGLLRMAARRWLDGDGAPALGDAVAVVVTQDGGETRFTLGRDAAGTALCLRPEGQAAEIDAALLERLLSLF